jgi:hypothetical protein
MELADLRNTHKGETVWVIGSGPSLNFLEPGFFADKIVVSTNTSARIFGFVPQYVFSHYHSDAQELIDDSSIVVTLAKNWDTGEPYPGPERANLVLVEQDSHTPPGSGWNPLTTHPPRKDSLAYGSSSLHGSMHLAAHLGASFIVLVGADCGTINDESNVRNYYSNTHIYPRIYNDHHKLMKDYLRQEYGVEVYSLNPFINFNLEGNTFHGAS